MHPMQFSSMGSTGRIAAILTASLLLCHGSAWASTPAPAPAQPGAPQANTVVSEDPAVAEDDVVVPSATATGTSDAPVIHVIDTRPDGSRGVVKLARHLNTTQAQAGNIVQITVNYDELCVVPCGVSVDNSERPIYFFMRDGSPITKGFRIPQGSDEFTIKLDPGRRGMLVAGLYLTVFFIYPVGIPLWISGKSRMWIASGPPSDSNDFVRLKKAKS